MAKSKNQYFNRKPVFRQKYAFCVRYSRNNVASLSLEEFRTRSINDRLCGIGDRSVERTIVRLNQLEMHLPLHYASLAIWILFFKLLSQNSQILNALVAKECELTGCINFVRRWSRSGMLMGRGIFSFRDCAIMLRPDLKTRGYIFSNANRKGSESKRSIDA